MTDKRRAIDATVAQSEVVRDVFDGYVTRRGDCEVGRMCGGAMAKELGDTFAAKLMEVR